jgi:hypothetical protein
MNAWSFTSTVHMLRQDCIHLEQCFPKCGTPTTGCTLKDLKGTRKKKVIIIIIIIILLLSDELSKKTEQIS